MLILRRNFVKRILKFIYTIFILFYFISLLRPYKAKDSSLFSIVLSNGSGQNRNAAVAFPVVCHVSLDGWVFHFRGYFPFSEWVPAKYAPSCGSSLLGLYNSLLYKDKLEKRSLVTRALLLIVMCGPNRIQSEPSDSSWRELHMSFHVVPTWKIVIRRRSTLAFGNTSPFALFGFI